MKSLLFPFYFSCLVLSAQVSRDSVLAAERAIDRPITLHKGQLRTEVIYGFSAITKSFDSEGTAIKLRDEGTSYVRHAWIADARYGILENLQVGVSTTYKNQSQRKQQVFITDNGGGLMLSEIQNKEGIDDVLLTITGRAPFTPKKIDLVGTFGAYLPVSKAKYKTPNHSIINEPDREIIYEYNSRWGRGAYTVFLGGNFKYRLKSYAFTGTLNYDYPLSTSENVQWQHLVFNDNFEYRKVPYTYQTPSRLSAMVEAERQLAPWFDLSLIVSMEQYSGAWEEINGLKVQIPDTSLLSFNPGYEILVTPKLWLRQRMFFGISGKATEVPFLINSSLVYNFFPF